MGRGQLPTFKRLYKNDFDEEYFGLIEKLSGFINDNFEKLYNVNTRNLTFTDNIYSQIVTLTITVDFQGNPLTNTEILINREQLQDKPLGIQVLRAINNTSDSVYPTSAPWVSYTENPAADGSITITINNIAGLPSDNEFELTLLLIGQ